MRKITPFMWFDRNAEEAMNFYTEIFASRPGTANGESKITRIVRYPEGITEGPAVGFDGQVLTGEFMLDGEEFMCIDGGPYFKPSGAISYLVDCADQAEVDHFWEKFSEGSDPASWQCGWITDKYGFTWQIVPKQLNQLLTSEDKGVRDRVMAVMMPMKKLIIADLEAAANKE